ncbi:hypothetical protein [Pantoea sp.]|uniref:hypothetical protein n=1 Tax=Pantoea sp. TaxID=69393 RepID=UPI0031CDF267
MQNNSYLNGMKAGRTVRAVFIFFRRVRYKMLVNAGQSRFRRNLVSMLYILMIITIMILASSLLYYAIGIIGPIIILLAAVALPKTYGASNNDDTYDFNDGYRDGPEGYGYYSGGYKMDD